MAKTKFLDGYKLYYEEIPTGIKPTRSIRKNASIKSLFKIIRGKR